MKNFIKSLLITILFSSIMLLSHAQQRQMRAPGLQDSLLLKDYKPGSIFVIPETVVLKARYPAIVMHMHAPRGGNLDSIALAQLKNMDEAGVKKTILFCGTGKTFDKLLQSMENFRTVLNSGVDLT